MVRAAICRQAANGYLSVLLGDIGTAEVVLGKGLATPLQLPW